MRPFRLGALLIFIANCTATASPIMLDVDASNAPASETQAGFTRMTHSSLLNDATNGAFSPTATVGGVTVTASHTVGTSPHFRDRGIGSPTVPTPPYQNLLRDFIGNEGVDGAAITVTISNLPVGTYQISTFHNDWNVAGLLNYFDIFVSDALVTNQLVVDNAIYSNSSLSYLGESFLVQSNGTSNISIRIVEDSTTNRVRFNGIIISDALPTMAVPEPGTFVVLGMMLAICGCFAYGRRRRVVAASAQL